MRILNIVTSPRKDQSASRALVEAFLREYMTQADDVVVDTLDVWEEWLPDRRGDDKREVQRCFGRADDTDRGHRLGENPRSRITLPEG